METILECKSEVGLTSAQEGMRWEKSRWETRGLDVGRGKRDIGFDSENLPKVVGPDYGQKILNFTDISA